MPATNFNATTLGRSVVDLSLLEEDTPEGIRKTFELIHQTIVGNGWPSPAQDGDERYQAVYAQYDGSWILYGGKPSDPKNPDVITVTSGSATIIVEDAGGVVEANTSTLKIIGTAVTSVTADGGGHVTVTVDDSGGSGGNAFTTIDVPTGTDAVADSSTDTLTLLAGNYTSITGSDPDTITIASTITAGLYIDIDGSGQISVDLTEISGWAAGAQQYLKNDAGTIKWVTVGECSS